MDDRLRTRLEQLREEYASGRETLEDLEAQVANVRTTMLRISGAIQVLEELLDDTGEADGEDASAAVPNGQAAPAAVT